MAVCDRWTGWSPQNFRVAERHRLQFRLEFFKAFNQVNLQTQRCTDFACVLDESVLLVTFDS
jgi:hypothetical protein